MKVINWLFGSFFRTIGRTIAILLMGGLLYYILASNGIGISDLFLDKVNASTFTSRQQQNFYIYPNQFTYESNSGFYKMDVTNNPHYIYFNNNYNLSSGMNLATDAKFVYFTMRFRTSTLATGVAQYNTFSVGVYYNIGDLTWCESVQSENYNRNNDTFTNEMKITYKCPVITGSSHMAVIYVNGHDYGSSESLGWQIAINPNFTVEIDSNDQGIQGVIQEQQDTNDKLDDLQSQQQQQHQEMMDDNTTAAEDEGSAFFGNFTSEDHGGLNAIITAPLNTIRSLLNSSCTKLTLPLPYVNKNLELPCMNDIYTQHFGLFFSLYQTIILAIISYRCLRSIFFDITGFTNPDDDRIEVMDL